jgi:O-antigen ligase
LTQDFNLLRGFAHDFKQNLPYAVTRFAFCFILDYNLKRKAGIGRRVANRVRSEKKQPQRICAWVVSSLPPDLDNPVSYFMAHFRNLFFRSLFVLTAGFVFIGLLWPLSFGGSFALLGLFGLYLVLQAHEKPSVPKILSITSFPFWFLTLALLLLGTSFFAENWVYSLQRACKVLALIGLSALAWEAIKNFSDAQKQKLQSIVIKAGLILGFVVLLYLALGFSFAAAFFPDHLFNPSIINKHHAIFVLFLPVITSLLVAHKNWPVYFLVLALALASWPLADSQAAQLALLMMSGFYLLYRLHKNWALRLVFMGYALMILVMPFVAEIMYQNLAKPEIMQQGLVAKGSVGARFEVWDFVADKIRDNPFMPHGIDSTRFYEFDTVQNFFPSNKILHPHNIGLQFWFEFGVLGIVWLLGFLLFLYRKIQSLPEQDHLLFGMIFIASGVFLAVSWSVWASWLLGALVTLVVLATLLRPSQRTLLQKSDSA